MKAATPAVRAKARSSASRVRAGKVRNDALQIRNILVPVDFSPDSLRAIEFALPLSKHFGAQLHLVHVFEADYPLTGLAMVPLLVPEREVGRRVRRQLEKVAGTFSLALRPENIHALKGKAPDEICRLAGEAGIDLIVASTHGHTGFKHLALGSTAERIVRYSPCPVLVVPRSGGAKRRRKMPEPKLTFQKILVPVDFSECSMKGVAYAKAMAKTFGAKLVLLHSIAVQYYITSDEYARYDLPLLMEQTEAVAREQMGALVRGSEWDGVEVESSLQIGHAGEQVCARAQEEGADVIVTSTHGTTGLKHVLLGSTAEYIVRHAKRPVLVVPSRARPRI